MSLNQARLIIIAQIYAHADEIECNIYTYI